MPIPQLPNGRLSPTGVLAFADVTTMLGRQIQPSFSWTDMVAGNSADYLRMGTSMRMDRVAGVAHAPMIYVPHHQFLLGTTCVDQGAYSASRTDLPNVTWSLVTTGAEPSVGHGSLSFQSFPDRDWQNEVIQFALNSAAIPGSVVPTLLVHLKSSQQMLDHASAGYVDYDEQGFLVRFSNFTVGGRASNNPSEIEVRWRLHAPGSAASVGILCRLVMSEKLPPRFYMGGRLLRDSSTNGNPLGTRGSRSLQNSTDSPYVQVLTVGGKMQITAMGLTEPIVVDVDSLMRADVTEDLGGGTWRLAKYSQFPASGTVWYWRGGGNPNFGAGWNGNLGSTTITGTTNDTLSISSGIMTKKTVAVLEPRTGEVELLFRGISHASWQLSPARWLPEWEYDSIQQQIAFTPDLGTTPWKYAVHTPGDWRETVSGVSWAHGLYPGSSITVSDSVGLSGTQVHQFHLNAQCPTVTTYKSTNVARYTIGINRVTSRIDGIHAYSPPNSGNTSLIPLGLGRTAKSALIQSVTESQNFDINSLQVTQSLSVGIRNHNGRAIDLQTTLGIGGIGNIGVAFRCGYAHQDAVGYRGDPWLSAGEPGFSRFRGYCDTYSYMGNQVVMSCQGDLNRVLAYQLMVAPLLDGWNHYRAVYQLLQMAEVPDARVGFMSKVPSDPSGVTVSDPDYATGGYLLPLGIGANPWTPVYENITVGQLLANIQKYTGHVLYCDAYGVYQYEPFLRSTPAGVPKRVFRSHDILDSNLAPVQFNGERVTFSTRDVRNIIALVGIDAFGPGNIDPIIAKLQDDASIYSAPGSQPINYVGFKQPFAWIDSRFASFGFATNSAERLFKILRQPTIEVSFRATGGQPDLFVMDWIVLEHWRSGLTGFPAGVGDLPLFITGISTTYQKGRGGEEIVSTITARYLDPTLAEDVAGVIG
jgi:hypothetical protein